MIDPQTTRDTITIDIKGDKVEVFYTASPRGVRLDCLAYVHERVWNDPALSRPVVITEARQEELEDLLPDWNARQDIKDMIHRSIYE